MMLANRVLPKLFPHLFLLLILCSLQQPQCSDAFVAPTAANFGRTGTASNEQEDITCTTRPLNAYRKRNHESETSFAARKIRRTNDQLLRQEMESQAREVVSSFISSMYGNNGFLGVSPDYLASSEGRSKYPIFDYFHEAVEFVDTSFVKSIFGKRDLMEHLEGNPTSLFHINGTLPWMNVGYVTTGSYVHKNGAIDVKVAVMYQYSTSPTFLGGVEVDTMDESFIKKYGVTFYTVSDGLISHVFDVRKGGEMNIANLWAEDVTDNVKMGTFMSDPARSQGLPQSVDKSPFTLYMDDPCSQAPDESVKNLITAFLDARNARNYESLRSMMWEDCVVNGIMMEKTQREREAYFQNLDALPKGVTYEAAEVVASVSPHLPKTVEVAVRWDMAVDGQQQNYKRGCTFFTIEDGLVGTIVDVKESAKQEKLERGSRKSVSRKNWVRDSGTGGMLADALLAATSPSVLMDNDPQAFSTFLKLSREKIKVKYGDHPSQYMDLFSPRDPRNQRGLVVFVHGGAWGSGKPWIYRLAATPFLEANMAVAIISYRRYPDGNVQDQVDDIELASKAIATKFPNILRQPDTVSNQDWMGTTLMGHSSGTHIALMAIVQRIERWATAFSAGVPEVEKFNESALHFDQVVGLSGVYSIRDHYHFEVSRGVDQISPMKPAAGYTTDAFSAYSPIERLAKTSSLALVQQQQADLLPDIFLLHGVRDDVVPFTGVNRAERVLRGIGYEKLSVEFFDIGHQETVMHLMFGGLTKDVVLGWLQRRPQRNEEDIFYV